MFSINDSSASRQLTPSSSAWDKARLAGKPTLDFRREGEFEDRAARWLAKADRGRQERRSMTPSTLDRSRGQASTRTAIVDRSSGWVTASSTGVPW
jgi:hypothetical protein